MQEITATEAKNNFGAFLNMAQHEPVRVMKNGREQAVLISEREYLAYQDYVAKQKLLAAMDAIGTEAKKRGLTPDILNSLLKDLS